MSSKSEKKKFEELKSMFEPEDFEYLQKNLKSEDPEVRDKINEIYARNNYLAKIFSSKVLLSEENLLDMAKKGPMEKAAAQTLLGRMIDNENYWDVPDYRYPYLEVDKEAGRTTDNDLYLGALNWYELDHGSKYTKFNGDEEYCKLKFLPSEEKISFEKNGTLLEISFLELFAILQKAREFGMSKPPTKYELFHK